MADDIGSAAWIERVRPRVMAANSAAGLEPTPAQLAAQLVIYQTQCLIPVFEALTALGGADVVNFAFRVAESADLPSARRRLALAMVETPAARDATLRRRLDSDRAWIDAVDRQREADPGRSAARVVAELRPRFRGCYQQELARAGRSGAYHGRLRITVGSEGAVSDAAVDGDLPTEFVACIEAVVRAARFVPQATPQPRKILVPLTFVPAARPGPRAE
jgi:hypothetical protein